MPQNISFTFLTSYCLFIFILFYFSPIDKLLILYLLCRLIFFRSFSNFLSEFDTRQPIFLSLCIIWLFFSDSDHQYELKAYIYNHLSDISNWIAQWKFKLNLPTSNLFLSVFSPFSCPDQKPRNHTWYLSFSHILYLFHQQIHLLFTYESFLIHLAYQSFCGS